MYFDEDMLLDIRLNTLEKYVKKFVIAEANYTHNGDQKKLKFDLNKFKKFKDKIIYLIVDQKPKDLRETNLSDLEKRNSAILDNAVLRENFQRNYLFNEIKKFHDEDLVIISDLDEIPNLENFSYKKRITIFKQKMIMYKLNLAYPDFLWTGSKLCKKKHLISPQWLRNIRTKIYHLWRLDIMFSKKKYNNLEIINDGGWHFSNIKSPENIDFKLKSFLHHLEYSESGLNPNKIDKIMKEKKVLYNYKVDQKKNKWKSDIILKTLPIESLPIYVKNNVQKFKDWID
tara:strand:- start:922 stop:1779 length:858 start_codon:yes stop_codon:yes gene_type:complete